MTEALPQPQADVINRIFNNTDLKQGSEFETPFVDEAVCFDKANANEYLA